jgi:hypothetical protein
MSQNLCVYKNEISSSFLESLAVEIGCKIGMTSLLTALRTGKQHTDIRFRVSWLRGWK